MYRTDVIDDGNSPAVQIAKRFEHLWDFHYKFFATAEILEAPEFIGSFEGLDLPAEVVEKILFLNAKRIFAFDR